VLNGPKHEKTRKNTSTQTSKTVNLHEKSEETNITSGKTHHRQEQQEHAAPVDRHCREEGTDTVEIHFTGTKQSFFEDFLRTFEITYAREVTLTRSEAPGADSRTCGITRTRKPVFQNLAKRNKWLREAANKNNYERNKKKQINRSCDKRSY
jgi:hypothetical protein